MPPRFTSARFVGREPAFARLAAVLDAASPGRASTLLLVVEDLHRADDATRALVMFLARIARGQRLAIVATYQADELTRSHPLVGDLDRIRDAPRPPARLEIGQLGRDEIAGLIEGIE